MFKRSLSGKCQHRHRPRLFLEELESRTLLSASVLDTLVAAPLMVTPQASASIDPQKRSGGGGGGGTTTGPYSPAQIRTAYGFNQVSSNGAGQTIAIVDAYNDPTIFRDLDTFDQRFSINGGTQTLYQQYGASSSFLKQVDQKGGLNLPSADSNWAMEIALDVEWAHAMAPAANIVLVEANSNSIDDLFAAVHTASNWTGVSVVSMSWGGSEFSGESSYDSYFQPNINGNHPNGYTNPGVTFVAASGDSGAAGAPIYPAVSPYVISVGGTHLVLNSSTSTIYSETGWGNGYLGSLLFGGSGGGYSTEPAYAQEPAYQASYASSNEAQALGNTVLSNTPRGNPDVAYNADPNTGYYIFDAGSWYEVGGTSAGAPQWSALIALANEGRSAPLSTWQTLSDLYTAAGSSTSYTSNFRDIKSGNNGYTAGPGYDLVTGLGSPNVAGVIATLTATSDPVSLAPATSTTSTAAQSTSGTNAKVFVASAGADPAPSSSLNPSSVFFAGVPSPAATAAGVPVLIEPAQTLGTSSFAFQAAAVSSLAFGSFQTTTASVTNSASQTPAVVPAWQLFPPGPKSFSTGSAALGSSLLTPFRSEAVDGGVVMGPDLSDDLGPNGLPLPQQAIRVPGREDLDLDLIPALPAEEGSEEMPACDACFVDEISMALVAEQTLALESGENQLSPELRGSGLALLGILASSLWMTPDRADEARKRRERLLRVSR